MVGTFVNKQSQSWKKPASEKLNDQCHSKFQLRIENKNIKKQKTSAARKMSYLKADVFENANFAPVCPY